jgi:hypothetical protein
MFISTRNPSLVVKLHDQHGKRITQSLEANSRDELRDKVDGRIHDLFIRSIAISSTLGVAVVTAVMLTIYYIGVSNITWCLVGGVVFVFGYLLAKPRIYRNLAWRHEWMRVRKESFGSK